MKHNYQHLLPSDFAADARVWIYQANRLFTLQEALDIEDMLDNFVVQWTSHGSPVKGYANLFFGQFIVLMADERATGVSGCSTDSSVRLIKEIEQKFGVNMFDRQLLAFVVKEKIELLPLSQLQYALANNFVTADTPYFNNLVQNKEELENQWIVAVRDSWLAKKVAV